MSNATKYAEPANQTDIDTAKTALETNGFIVTVVDDLDQAKNTVLGMIPEGSEAFTNTSVTLDQSGISAEINESGKYDSVRKKLTELYGQPDKAIDMRRLGSAMDYSLGSVHALTKDGKVLIASASGSQLPGYVYGASHVIWVVGSQKIVNDLTEAMDRLEKHSFPLEDARATKAYDNGSSINKILIYQKEPAQRINIVIVKRAVGY